MAPVAQFTLTFGLVAIPVRLLTARTIEISGFLDLASIPGEMYDKPYFLTPQSPAANKPFVLIREALARAGKAAAGKYALRGSEDLG